MMGCLCIVKIHMKIQRTHLLPFRTWSLPRRLPAVIQLVNQREKIGGWRRWDTLLLQARWAATSTSSSRQFIIQRAGNYDDDGRCSGRNRRCVALNPCWCSLRPPTSSSFIGCAERDGRTWGPKNNLHMCERGRIDFCAHRCLINSKR